MVKYDFTFHYNVLYSGVKSLRIDVPKTIADGLRVTTPGYHETQIEGMNFTGGSLSLAGSPEPPRSPGTLTFPKGLPPTSASKKVRSSG